MKTIVKLLCIVLLLTTGYAAPSRAQDSPVTSMWVWDFYKSLSTGAQRQELIQISVKNEIGLLFVGTRNTLQDQPEQYVELIREAHKNGIRVFALTGKAAWALRENHQAALEQLEQVLDYNAGHPSESFDGFQFDIEPYTLTEYKDNPGAVGKQMLELFEASAKSIPTDPDARGRFELNAAVPFWYAGGQQPLTVEYNGRSKPLSHHILDIVDSITIMAYRDNAAAQIKLSKADVDYASAAGKKAYVGAETMPANGSSIPESITYYGKELSYLTRQLEAIDRHYAGHPGFAGVALHSYDSFKAMLRKEEDLRKPLDQKFNVLQAAGIFKGYTDGSARYGRKATRAEIAAVAARMAGYTDENLARPSAGHFEDVPPEAWYYGWVEAAYRLGVMNGKGDAAFAPNANITVEETLIVMAKLLGLAEAKGASVQGASVWSQGWVKAAIDAGLVGRRETYNNEIARDDLIDIVYKAFLLYIKKEV